MKDYIKFIKRVVILMVSAFLIVIIVKVCDFIPSGCRFFYSKDEAKFTITDFSKKRVDTLIPHKDKSYMGSFIKIKGYTNDTIKIRMYYYDRDQAITGGYDKNISGVVNTIFRDEYYDIFKAVICTFDPYKATEGNLQIEYDLY